MFGVLPILYHANVDALNFPWRFIVCEDDLFAVEIFESALPERQLFFLPVVRNEIFRVQPQEVVVVIDVERREYLAQHNFREGLVVELQEVGKRFVEQEAREDHMADFRWQERRKVILRPSSVSAYILDFILHQLVVSSLRFRLLIPFVLDLFVLIAVGAELPERLDGNDHVDESSLEELVEMVTDEILAEVFLVFVEELVQLRKESLFLFAHTLPRPPRFLLLNRAVFQVYQKLYPIVV